MKTQGLVAACCLLTLLAIPGADAQEHDHGAAPLPEGLALPDDLRALLGEEMNQIDEGMQTLVADLSAGRWHDVASTAKAIQASYILKQRLSVEQRHQLHELLPSHFQELDKAFHHDAGRLAAAAEAGDTDVAGLYYSRLVQGCMNCHSRFAGEAFPGFRPKSTPHDH